MELIIRRALAGLRWLLVGVTGAAVLAGGAVAFGAATSVEGHDRHTVAFTRPDHEWRLLADNTIGNQQAVDMAVKAVPGATVVSTELDTDQGALVWEVELVTADRIEYEVTVDAKTGAVLATRKQN